MFAGESIRYTEQFITVVPCGPLMNPGPEMGLGPDSLAGAQIPGPGPNGRAHMGPRKIIISFCMIGFESKLMKFDSQWCWFR